MNLIDTSDENLIRDIRNLIDKTDPNYSTPAQRLRAMKTLDRRGSKYTREMVRIFGVIEESLKKVLAPREDLERENAVLRGQCQALQRLYESDASEHISKRILKALGKEEG